MDEEKREYRKLPYGNYETKLSYIHSDSRGDYEVSKIKLGGLPIINIVSKNIPAAWELAMLACWDYGIEIHTHYDKKDDDGNYIDPPSKDARIVIYVDNPFNEPTIHKNFPGGPVELESYRQEVVYGIHDHLINPQDKKWTYTYHNRITNYNPSEDLRAENMGKLLKRGVNQIEEGILKPLTKDPTTKGAQAITWIPMVDPDSPGDRPCLQRIWVRSVLEDKKEEYVFHFDTHWRSRDLYKAWFMNVHAMASWQKHIAGELEKRLGKPVKVGSYVDISNSLHIYGSYWKTEKFVDDIRKMRTDNIEDRTWNSDHSVFVSMTEEARENLAKDPDFYLKGDSV